MQKMSSGEGAAPAATPTPAPAPAAKVITQADIEATAKASKKSVEEVRAAAERKGYTIK
jgi:hypothetical protein